MDATEEAPRHRSDSQLYMAASTPAQRVFRLIQLATLVPVAALVVAYFVDPGFQSLVQDGTSLLIQGKVRGPDGLQGWAARCSPWAWLATSLLMVIQALAAPIPAVLVTATNSLLFGWFWGGVISIVSATVASLICYALARSLGEPLVVRLVGRAQLQKTDAFIERNGTTAVLVARLVPFVPFDPISYVAGVARMPVWSFTWATLLGQVPAGMTYSYLAYQALLSDGSPQEVNKLLIVAPSLLLGLAVIGFASRRVLLPGEGKRDNDDTGDDDTSDGRSAGQG